SAATPSSVTALRARTQSRAASPVTSSSQRWGSVSEVLMGTSLTGRIQCRNTANPHHVTKVTALIFGTIPTSLPNRYIAQMGVGEGVGEPVSISVVCMYATRVLVGRLGCIPSGSSLQWHSTAEDEFRTGSR